MTYEQTNERMAFNELYARWTEFMKYTNHKAKTICPELLREYCNFVSNVALRFGSVNAIYNCPEVPSETLGQYVRDYERALVEWSGYLAGFERREASFRKLRIQPCISAAKCAAKQAPTPVSCVVETDANTSDPAKIIDNAIAKATDGEPGPDKLADGAPEGAFPVVDREPVEKPSKKGKK